MKKIWLPLLLCLSLMSSAVGQDNNYGVKGFNPQTFEITDSMPVMLNGLKAGYEIRSVDMDSKKDNQSRYKIYFYLTNTTNEARIMYQNPAFLGHSGPINNNLAQFNCLNATGARLTNKMATMQLQPCKVMAKVEDKSCDGNSTTINTRLVELGYWIRPGETVSKTYPMYVPQNEKPKITVTFNPEVANQSGVLLEAGSSQQQSQEPGFAKIKNFAFNTYLNNQPGNLQCTNIDREWWSSDWQIIPVPGTENFQIRNRWKSNFISTDNGMLTSNGNTAAAMWTIQESNSPNLFYIKNVGNNARLFVENGMLKTSNSFISNDNTSKWVIEK